MENDPDFIALCRGYESQAKVKPEWYNLGELAHKVSFKYNVSVRNIARALVQESRTLSDEFEKRMETFYRRLTDDVTAYSVVEELGCIVNKFCSRSLFIELRKEANRSRMSVASIYKAAGGTCGNVVGEKIPTFAEVKEAVDRLQEPQLPSPESGMYARERHLYLGAVKHVMFFSSMNNSSVFF
jgi:DNA-directed RNA polymerase subunit N (RpoN/RPB10)